MVGLFNVLLAVASAASGKPCIADQLPAWATASPAEKKALLDHCRAPAPPAPPAPPAAPEVTPAPAELAPEPLALQEPPAPEPTLRVYAITPGGLLVSFPSSGRANFREWTLRGFVTGAGARTTPVFATPLVLDGELGVVILDRYRIAIEGIPYGPALQVAGHVGYDVAHFLHTRQGVFGAITLWAGGGYEHLSFTSTDPQSYGAFASARATYEHKWGVFFLRVETFARLQFVTQFDQDNEGEGQYWTFPAPMPNLQLGVKLGAGVSFP